MVDQRSRYPQHRLPTSGLDGAALPLCELRRAIQYINDNLDSRLSRAAIAAAAGLSSFKFGRCFKQAIGVTPHQYVIRCRVERAIKLLDHSELSIADIALEIGCSCQSHFTTLFRSHTGMTPRAFRRAAEASRRRLFGTLGQPPSPPSLRDAVLAASEIAA